MPKKRTAKFGYGKQEQRLEALAHNAFRDGEIEFGNQLVAMVAQSVRASREAGPGVRKPAPWVPNIKGTRFAYGERIARKQA